MSDESVFQNARRALNNQNWRRARALFGQLLKLSPGDPALVGSMGFACLQMARRGSDVQLSAKQTRSTLDAAVFHLRQAALNDRSPRTYRLLGEAQQQAGDYAAAEESFRSALKLDGNLAEVWNLLGRVLVDTGRKDEAANAFEKALTLSPKFPDAWHQLRRLSPSDEPQRELDAVVAAINEPTDFPIGRSALHMTAGRLCEQVDDFQSAYQHYKAAGEIKPAPAAFTPSLSERTEAIQFHLDQAFFETRQEWGDPSATPIFIIGLPRSGTTLMEQLLQAHPDVFGAGELTDMMGCKQQLVRRSAGWIPGSHPLLHATAGHVRHLAVGHSMYLDEISGGASHVVDKMPGNFAHLDVIKLMFPNARIVHCTRDPRDVWVSCVRNNLDRPYGAISDMAEYQANYRVLMDHWSDVFDDQIFHLNYETFVSEPEPWTRRLVEYCGLSWSDACLTFFDSERAVRTPSKLEVRKPVFNTSVGTWQQFRPAIDGDVSQLAGVTLDDPAGTAWKPAN